MNSLHLFPVGSDASVEATVCSFWGWLGDRVGATERLGLPTESGTGSIIEATLAQSGVAGLDLLVGEFAAVVETTRGPLLIRDHLGLVPLYYGWDGQGLLHYGPDIEMVRNTCWDGTVRTDVLTRELARAISFGPAEETFFQGVSLVPAGHVAWVVDRRVRVERYFRPELVPAQDWTFAQAVEALDTAVHAAVQDGLQESSGVGVHVSGGIDSGVVAAIVQQRLALDDRGADVAYGWVPALAPGKVEAPEQRVVRLTAQQLGLEVEEADISQLSDSWLSSADPLIFPPWRTAIYEALAAPRFQAANVDVVFCGWGGDEIASATGRPIVGWLLRSRRWRDTLAELGATDARTGRSGWHRAARQIPPSWARRLVRSRRTETRPGAAVWVEYDPNLRTPSSSSRPKEKLTRQRQESRLWQGHLSRRAEGWWKIANKFGYQYRYPLLDQRVIRCSLGMSPDHFRAVGVGRRAFRELASRYLPDEVAYNLSKSEPVRAQEMKGHRLLLAEQIAGRYPEITKIVALHAAANTATIVGL